MKKVVVIGGGTGTYTVLRGLREYKNLEISVIVNMADDGGSAKVLRDEFGLLPTSGVRQCIAALSEEEWLLRELFSYRYHQGMGIAGMTFGNLFMAAVADILGSQRAAITETCRILGVRGKILPISYDKISLLATYEDGTEVLGEHYIDTSSKKVGKQRIVTFRTVPEARLDKEAKKAIEEADLIVLGPGDLYTNTVTDLVVKGVPEALKKSRGKLCFVVNLMTKYGETYGYKASDFLKDLEMYLGKRKVDTLVVNTDFAFTPSQKKAYLAEQAEPVADDLGKSWGKAKIVREKLVDKKPVAKQRGDKVKRSMIRHDATKLAKILAALV